MIQPPPAPTPTSPIQKEARAEYVKLQEPAIPLPNRPAPG